MNDPGAKGIAELLRVVLEKHYTKVNGAKNARILVSDISLQSITELFSNKDQRESEFKVTDFSWCLVEKDWGPEIYQKLKVLLPQEDQDRSYDSLTRARNDTNLPKPAILLAPPLSNERESLKDLELIDQSTILNNFPEYAWVDLLIQTLGKMSNVSNFDDISADLATHARRLARILTKALGRQDPIARWCNAIWKALTLLEIDKEMTPKQAIGKSIVSFKLFSDASLLDEEDDERAIIRVVRNADEARQVRGGEVSERKLRPDISGKDKNRVDDIIFSPPDVFPDDVDYESWQKSFIRRARPSATGLGDLIRARLDNDGNEEARDQFNEDIKDALNGSESAAAEVVLANPNIVRSLNRRLLTKLENLVNPEIDTNTVNFFVELQQTITQMVTATSGTSPKKILISLDDSKWNEHLPSRRTLEGFEYLHMSLLELIANSETTQGSIDIGLLRKDISKLREKLDDLENETTGGDMPEEDLDSSIRLHDSITFNLGSLNEGSHSFTWAPEQWEAETISFHLQELMVKLERLREVGLGDLSDLYADFYGKEQGFGIPSIERADLFCKNWSAIIRNHRRLLSQSRNACELVLSLHILRDEHDAKILFTHPERIRWLRKYLDKCAFDIIDSLNGKFQTNPGNPGRYSDWMRDRAPVGLPAFVHGSNIRECLLPTVEGPLNSLYENIIARSDHDTQIPIRFVTRIAKAITNYLEVYPYKKDGLSIAIFESSSTDPISVAIVEQILKSTADLQLSCDVYCNPDGKESILNNFSSNSVITRHNQNNQRANSIKPPFELRLLNGSTNELPIFDSKDTYDVTLLIDFFSKTPEATKKLTTFQVGNSFDGLTDDTTHWQFLNIDPIQLVKNLLPLSASPMLQEWSTLSVWVTENGPANDDNTDMTEFIQIQTGFNSQVAAYRDIHRYSRWVISLDQVLGRQQFETIPDPPEVLQIVQDLGTNASHTMIVSSNENRRVIKRIERNIRTKAPAFASQAAGLAQAAYETARELSPRQILSSGGESSTYLEVIGLAASYVHLSRPKSVTDGWELWLSFDDMTDWFEFGNQSRRPDLLRILVQKKGNDLAHLDFMIVECKQREVFSEAQVAGARRQAQKGHLFIDSIVQSIEMNDSWMWRSDLASVMPTDQIGDKRSSVGAINKIGNPGIELRDVGQMLRSGYFTTSVSAALVRVGFAISELQDQDEDGVRMIKISLATVLSELSARISEPQIAT
jgi:hypothetical protein